MKKAITLLAICSMLLSGCGQIDDAVSKQETTTTTAAESTADADTTETSSAKEEKDTSEAATTTIKSSQTVTSASSPTGTTVTTTKKSGSSNENGNSNQGQNNSVQNNNGQGNNHQENNQPAQNDPQPDNLPSNDPQSNDGAEQNNRPTDKPQNNNPSPPVTTAKPAVTNPPTTTTPKPQTEPPAPEPTEEERYMDIGRNLSHDGSDYGKAEAVYNWMTENGSGTCVNFSWQTYYLCKGMGLECYLAWTPSKLYGHVANVVKVNGTWFVLDTQGQGFLLNNDCGFSEIIDIDESYISSANMISRQRYDEIY